MLDVYSVHAPSVYEVFLDYESADAFRNQCIVDGYHEVSLLHRKVEPVGGSLGQRAAAHDALGIGTTDLYSLAEKKAGTPDMRQERERYYGKKSE